MPAPVDDRSDPAYPLLYLSERGLALRLLARIFLLLAVAATAALTVVALGRPFGDLNPSLAVWALPALALAIVWTAAASTLLRARRTVIRLQLWPRSHLAVVHTPGVWAPRIDLLPAGEFGEPGPTAGRRIRGFDPAAGPGSVRVRLKSGRVLLFDPEGRLPAGPEALEAFLRWRTYPDAGGADDAAAGSARRGYGRETSAPKFPVDRVVGALEAADLEAARLDIIESVVKRRQQQRIGKFHS